MVIEAVVMMFVLINGEVIACQGESIANLTDHGGARQLLKYVKWVKTHICHQKLIGKIEFLY